MKLTQFYGMLVLRKSVARITVLIGFELVSTVD